MHACMHIAVKVQSNRVTHSPDHELTQEQRHWSSNVSYTPTDILTDRLWQLLADYV